METLEQLVRVETVQGSPLEIQLVVDAVVIMQEEATQRDRLELLASHIRSVIKRGFTAMDT